MPSDFAAAGRRFQAAIPVPDLPISSIRDRSRAGRAQHRSRLIVACALAAIAVLGSGSVLAARMSGMRIWLSGNSASGTITSFATITNPTPEDLRRVVSDATFPVVLPLDVPEDLHLNLLVFSPADHPNVILVKYENRKTGSAWTWTLADSSAVEHGANPLFPSGGTTPVATVKHWNVGGETVIFSDRGNFARQTQVEAAMQRSTPSQSLAQSLSKLYRVESHGGSSGVVDVANAVAPNDGRNVLVGHSYLISIAALARDRKPLITDSRTRVVGNLPWISGKPDWAHQSSHVVKEVAVSADGVRAIAAVLATNACGNAPQFTCEILFNERSGQAYRIWAMPLRSPASSVKYIVDPTTLLPRQEH
jgi:hypothetical protein